MHILEAVRSGLRPLAHRFYDVPAVNYRAFYAAYGPVFRSWCRQNGCEELPDRYDLLAWLAREQELIEAPIHYIEFGVFKGDTLRWWLQMNHHPESTFTGFDTFEGLPEDWEDVPRGSFSAGGALPRIDDSRCSLVQGLFQDTLTGWLAGREFTHRIVVNLDADLYSSTLFSLTRLMPVLRKNDVLIFDEFNAYLYEFRALADALLAYRREVAPLCHTSEWRQAAVLMK